MSSSSSSSSMWFQQELIANRPKKIQDLWTMLLLEEEQHDNQDDDEKNSINNSSSTSSHDVSSYYCTLGENMNLWVTNDEEVTQLLLSENDHLVDTFSQSAEAVIDGCDMMYMQPNFDNTGLVFTTNCRGCCNANCPTIFSYTKDISEIKSLCRAVHVLLTTMGVINNLLVIRDDDEDAIDSLVLALTHMPPSGKTMTEWVKEIGSRGSGLLHHKFVVMDRLAELLNKCGAAFPKIGIAASTMVSLLVVRRPAACFANLTRNNKQELITGCIKRIEYAFYFTVVKAAAKDKKKKDPSLKSALKAYWGTIMYLNILPLFYYVGYWNAVSDDITNTLAGMVSSMIVNLNNVVNIVEGGRGSEEDAGDGEEGNNVVISQWSLDERIQHGCPSSFWGPLFIRSQEKIKDGDNDSSDIKIDWRLNFLERYPVSFAIMATIEVLYQWLQNGLLVKARVLTRDGGDVPVGQYISENCTNIIEAVIERHGEANANASVVDLTYIRPLVDSLEKNEVPPKRTSEEAQRYREQSLLGGPFESYKRCGLPSCRAKARRKLVGSSSTVADETDENSDNAGLPLMTCTGCNLERYCCQEHQKEHFPVHKVFCKQQQQQQQQQI